MYYIGIRTCEGDPKHDLGIKYFSSSSHKEFIQDQKTNPACYEYQVLNTFPSREQLILAEIFTHSIWQVKDDPKSYNRVNATVKMFDCKGMKWSDAQRLVHSQRCKGKKLSSQHKLAISKSNLGKSREQVTCERISKATKGKAKPQHVQDIMLENSKHLAILRSQGYYKVSRITDRKVMCVGKFTQWLMGLEGWYRVTRICDKKQMDLCQFKNWYNASLRTKPEQIQVTRINDSKVMNLKQFKSWLNKYASAD